MNSPVVKTLKGLLKSKLFNHILSAWLIEVGELLILYNFKSQ